MAAAEQPDLKPITLAALGRAFCELEETKRKIRMKPLPKAIDVSKRNLGRKASSGIGATEA